MQPPERGESMIELEKNGQEKPALACDGGEPEERIVTQKPCDGVTKIVFRGKDDELSILIVETTGDYFIVSMAELIYVIGKEWRKDVMQSIEDAVSRHELTDDLVNELDIMIQDLATVRILG